MGLEGVSGNNKVNNHVTTQVTYGEVKINNEKSPNVKVEDSISSKTTPEALKTELNNIPVIDLPKEQENLKALDLSFFNEFSTVIGQSLPSSSELHTLVTPKNEEVSLSAIQEMVQTYTPEQKAAIARNLVADDPLGIGKMTNEEIKNYAENIELIQEKAIDIQAHLLAVTEMPEDLRQDLQAKSEQIVKSISMGNVEDAMQQIMEVQIMLQDSRVKFDKEAIEANKLNIKQTQAERVKKLYENIEKLAEAKRLQDKYGPLFKALGITLILVGFIAALFTGGAAGALMAVGATIMATAMILNETGAMEKMCGGNKNAMLGVNIALTVLSIACSLGAGFVSAPKAATDVGAQVARQSAQTAARIAARKAAEEAAKGATKKAIHEATKKAVEKGLQSTVDDVVKQATKEGMSASSKELIKKSAENAAKEVAENAAKKATEGAMKGLSRKAIEASIEKSITSNAKSLGSEAAKLASQELQSSKIQRASMFIQRGAQFGQGATTVAQGGIEIHATKLKKEAEDYGADAKELLAFLTRMQFLNEVLMENIKVIYEQLQGSMEITSDTIKNAFESKHRILSNLNTAV